GQYRGVVMEAQSLAQPELPYGPGAIGRMALDHLRLCREGFVKAVKCIEHQIAVTAGMRNSGDSRIEQRQPNDRHEFQSLAALRLGDMRRTQGDCSGSKFEKVATLHNVAPVLEDALQV